jgi:hypothetical protein
VTASADTKADTLLSSEAATGERLGEVELTGRARLDATLSV